MDLECNCKINFLIILLIKVNLMILTLIINIIR